MPGRREFLQMSAAALTALPVLPSAATSAAAAFDDEDKRVNPLCVFTKPFNSLTADQLGAKIAELGFQGIEAPIRRGGHIQPAAVVDELPKFVADLRRHNVDITIMTSDINDPRDPQTEVVLRTAAEAGIGSYRMKYFKYDESKSITGQITEWRAQLKDLAAMNHDLGITGVYQNHAGRNYFGAPIWDLHMALDGIDPASLGVAYDIRHATVEAGMSWPIGYHLIRPHIRAVYIKDFRWGKTKSENVPLGDGRVDRKFFQMLADSQFSGPISLHEEYLDHKQPRLVPEHWKAIAADLKTLKSWL